MFTKNVKGEDENSDGAYPTITNQGFIKQTVLEVIGKYSTKLILSFSNFDITEGLTPVGIFLPIFMFIKLPAKDLSNFVEVSNLNLLGFGVVHIIIGL